MKRSIRPGNLRQGFLTARFLAGVVAPVLLPVKVAGPIAALVQPRSLQAIESDMTPSADSLRVVVPQDELRHQNIEPALATLRKLLASPEIARAYRERVDIAFAGYDHPPRHLGEIREIRDYVRKLDARFPFWLYFLSRSRQGLQCILSCHLLPFLTEEGRAEHHPRQLEQLLVRRWLPAMSIVAEFADFSAAEIEEMTGAFLWYVRTGRVRPAVN